MQHHAHALIAVLLSLLAFGAGCSRGEPEGAERSAARPAAPARATIDIDANIIRGFGADRWDSGTNVRPAPRVSYAPVRPTAPPAEIDLANRYLAAVMVTTNATNRPDGEVKCSGVLIGPGLALTAAQCVCMRSPAIAEPGKDRTVVGSACAPSAAVSMVTFEKPLSNANLTFTHTTDYGEVRPHPAFQLRLDGEGRVTAPRADLAVVLLSEPMTGVEPVGLAEDEIHVGETLVLAGFIPQWPGSFTNNREFVKTRALAEVRPGGEFQVEPSTLSLDGDNRGGPCLRETERGLVVVGLSSGDPDGSPSCVSILAYHSWLAEELQNAASVETVPPGISPAVPSPR